MTGDRRRGALCVAFTAAWFLGVIARRSKAVETGFAHSIEIVEPQEGETVSATPFRVLIQTTGGFRVPEDGEIQLTMTYEGRGREVRVIQSLEFFCWNVLEAPLEISATLITTKNEPASAPAVVRVWQERGPHFVLNAPTTGQLLIAQTAVPFLFMFGGEVPEGAQVCAEVVCTSPGRSPEQLRRCMYDEGAAVSAQGANMRMDVALPAGNCSASVAVLGADGAPLSRAERRTFRVVEEQHECPAGSGVACLHGDCAGDGAAARCVCDSGFAGRQCAEAARPAGGAVGLEAAYLHLVKAALLDELYAKDRPGETAVVARSMVGRAGLDSLQRAVEELLDRGVPGDLMETGVWQGGSCMLMAAVLRARGATDRKVWVVDSFEGCPPPDAEAYPQDAADRHHTFTNLQVALNKVSSNFADFGLLSSQVEFVRGWFRDSMYSERVEAIERLALLRLDGDLYQSTIEALRGAYYKLSVGGVVIVDDWRLDGMQARQAVIDFHAECEMAEQIHVGADGLAWWVKQAPSEKCG